MEPLTPFVAIAGGLLIGSAAALFLLLSGRIAGVSGMTAIATRIGSGGTPRSQAAAFLIGLMNPVGLFVLLGSAVASSFGGPSGLLWAPYNIRAGAAAAQPLVIQRDWIWIVLGAATILAEGLILGPSLRF